MFEQSLLGRTRTKTPYSVCASLLFESLLIGVAMLLPLIYTSPLPARQLMSYLVAPPPGPTVVTSVKARETAPARLEADKFLSPAVIPRKIALIDDTASGPPPTAIPGPTGGIRFGFPGGGYDKVIGDIALATPIAPPPAVPVVQTPKAPPARIRVSMGVQKSKQVYAPLPVYPELARRTGTAGTVRLTAIIGKDGAVQHLTLVSGHPLLAPAAMEAVAKWRYSPTLLSGEPVEVLTQIDVNFMLNR